MVEKVKAECIEIIQNMEDYRELNAIWRQLLQTVDRELSPETYMTRGDLNKWKRQMEKNGQNCHSKRP